jgi:hypothetical protein
MLRVCLVLTVGLAVVAPGSAQQTRSTPGPSPRIWRTQRKDVPDAVLDFLRHNTGYRLVEAQDFKPDTDLMDGFLHFGPLDFGDANVDDHLDIAVALVKDNAPKSYSVVVLLSKPDSLAVEAIWVIRDSAEPIVGVRAGLGFVSPGLCYACDANPVLRWVNGRFEANTYRFGDLACISAGTKIYQHPQAGETPVATAEKTMLVMISGIGKEAPGNLRWYETVSINVEPRFSGWLLTRNPEQPGDCD